MHWNGLIFPGEHWSSAQLHYQSQNGQLTVTLSLYCEFYLSHQTSPFSFIYTVAGIQRTILGTSFLTYPMGFLNIWLPLQTANSAFPLLCHIWVWVSKMIFSHPTGLLGPYAGFLLILTDLLNALPSDRVSSTMWPGEELALNGGELIYIRLKQANLV